MWPNDRIQQNVVSSSRNIGQEIDDMPSYQSSTPISPHHMPAMAQSCMPTTGTGLMSSMRPNDASESDSDAEHLGDDNSSQSPNCKPMDLLSKALESYAAVQRTTAVRRLRCECSEGLAARTDVEENWREARDLASRYNHLHPRLQWSAGSARVPQRSLVPPRVNRDSCQSSSKTCHNTEGSASLTPDISLVRQQLHFIKSRMPEPSLLATQVANRVINYARCVRNDYEEDLCCLNCGLFPICPVTSNCGHTRCNKCVNKETRCLCGNESTTLTSVNILIQDLYGKKTGSCPVSRNQKAVAPVSKIVVPPENKLLYGERESSFGPIRNKSLSAPSEQLIPMTARARFKYALKLLRNGRHKDAAPQLALAAASYYADLRVAKSLLAQVIMVLSRDRDPRSMTRELNHSVRHLSSVSWIKTDDLECTVCGDILNRPVTTPCGHVFCRTCLERTLDYRKKCPLCRGDLTDFNLFETKDTTFVRGALGAINALITPKPMEEDDIVPIFVCTVAYPSVPCPLIVFDPRYWLMIRRVLSGSRRFGMVAMDRKKKYADYGTILEVRDCVLLEDGRSILSTVGLSRFKVIEKSVRDGCEVAQIQMIHDVAPDSNVPTEDIKEFASQLIFKSILWLSSLDNNILSDIESTFGRLPFIREETSEEEWWVSTDGPAWLWWLVAVLPLRMEIKVLILSTDCLIKRMMAVARTLEAVEYSDMSLTHMAPGKYAVRVNMSQNNL